MSNRNVRISGGLLLVVLSLVLASLACYSGQIPGVFELTPYYTPTPLPVAQNPKFEELEVVLAPREPRAFFYLTVLPEPLLDNITNSKAMCRGDSPARILYTGIAPEAGGELYLNGTILISAADLNASNGMIHAIDAVLVPTAGGGGAAAKPEVSSGNAGDKAITAVLAGDDRFTTLVKALETAEMMDVLSSDGPFTLFAPTDSAFAFYFGKQDITEEEFLSDRDKLTDFLMNHLIIGEKLSRADLSDKGTVTTALGQTVSIVQGNIYYLVDCEGSVGWVAEERLYGPLNFSTGDLALALAGDDPKAVPLLDDQFRPMLAGFGTTCIPGTVVNVQAIEAADPEGDGTKDIYYQINCPIPNSSPIKGWVTDDVLFGPLEMEAEGRAIAMSLPGEPEGQYLLASEPAPVTEENAVAGCTPGAILQSSEIQLVENTAYYKVSCGPVEGWTTPDRFVGPLLYDPNMYTVIYIPPKFGFADQLPPGAIIISQDATAAEGEPAEGEAPPEEAAATEGEPDVIEYIEPLYLTSDPGPAIVAGEGQNVVGQCLSNQEALILDYAGLDTVYYQINCDECTRSEVNEDGETVCQQYETREGWVEQSFLKGPLAFVPGNQTRFSEQSPAVMEEADGRLYARIPATTESAFALSPSAKNLDYAGRCLLDEGVEVTAVQLEKARTSDEFNFYYQIECVGESAIVTQVTENQAGKVVIRKETTFETGERTTITGWVRAKELVPLSELEQE